MPCALSHENMIQYLHMWSSDVKRPPLLWWHNKSCRCSRLAIQKYLSEIQCSLVFYWWLCNKQNTTWPLGDTEFLFSCWKIFHEWVLSTLEGKVRISAWSCTCNNLSNVSTLYFMARHENSLWLLWISTGTPYCGVSVLTSHQNGLGLHLHVIL